MNNTYETDSRAAHSRHQGNFDRFVKYLSTRKVECWGFFIAGLFIGGLFF